MQVFYMTVKTPTDEFDRSEIEEALFGRLLVPRMSAAVYATQDRALAKYGITSRQGALLLNCVFGEANTPAELARLQDLDISTITRMVERLSKKGLLRRTRDRHDRRRVNLTVTPEGRALLKLALPVAMEVSRNAWRGVTDEEKQALRSISEKVLKNVGSDPGPQYRNID